MESRPLIIKYAVLFAMLKNRVASLPGGTQLQVLKLVFWFWRKTKDTFFCSMATFRQMALFLLRRPHAFHTLVAIPVALQEAG